MHIHSSSSVKHYAHTLIFKCKALCTYIHLQVYAHTFIFKCKVLCTCIHLQVYAHTFIFKCKADLQRTQNGRSGYGLKYLSQQSTQLFAAKLCETPYQGTVFFGLTHRQVDRSAPRNSSAAARQNSGKRTEECLETNS